jgi:hypothetical protein
VTLPGEGTSFCHTFFRVEKFLEDKVLANFVIDKREPSQRDYLLKKR